VYKLHKFPSFICPVRALGPNPRVNRRIERINPIRMAGCKRQLNEAVSVSRFILSVFLMFAKVALMMLRYFVFSVCVLLSLSFFRFSCQYLPSDWLERLL